MAEVNYTKDQQKVIDLRNRNILVSAAAGSGKTAVLVERIISMITDESNPIDVDRLLIVTFTNAAAAEMRERIMQAIEKKLDCMPDNKHLQKQMMLIHSAQITTIHSFCLNVIRNHFNEIELDPSFRIAEEAELTLLQADVMEELLEEYYDRAEEDFTTFVEAYASGKTDTTLEELIIQLHRFSMSYPWPESFLLEQVQHFEIEDLEQLEQSEWMQQLMEYLNTLVDDLKERNAQAMAIASSFQGPYMYSTALDQDAKLFEALAQAKTFHEYAFVVENIKWAALSRERSDFVTIEKREMVKNIRNDCKKAVEDMKKGFFFQSEEDMLQDIQKVAKTMKMLIQLTNEFRIRYQKAKEDKNILDFNDLEHFALDILVRRENGVEQASSVAKELSEYYEEILIDEYQDSNLVQEKIVTAISKQRLGKNNLFMVGDVKQSIYKFRLARPELFMEKFMTYSVTDSKEQRIDLHKNFRSRSVVLSCINYIFEQIMVKHLGNIEYNEEAALNPGAVFKDTEQTVSTTTEVLLVTEGEKKEELDNATDKVEETTEEYSVRELEARAIGKRIKELTNKDTGLKVWDKESESYVTARYCDIVILLRTMSGWSQTFADTLLSMGIPAFSDTQSGYFSSLEIQTILNMLRVVDNPRQDIALTAVLHSSLVGLTTNDLAIIRTHAMDLSMYDACLYFLTEIEDNQKVMKNYDKLLQFFNRLDSYRECMAYTSIHELITRIVTDSGYYAYVSAMPAGDRRKANIDMLIERAVAYEATSYHGVFQFVRYIEKLHKYDIDFGEAVTVGENENTVRIMSIHKSKGLEFPIVFAAGMTKPFNNMDARSKIVLHPELGIGPDYIDTEQRTKTPTLLKKFLQRKIVLENLAEELRVLYVAFTRAKEKLIISGYVSDVEARLKKWSDTVYQEQKELLFQKLSSAGCYLDWIMEALVRHPDCNGLLCNYGIAQYTVLMPDERRDVDANFTFRIMTLADVLEDEVVRQLSNQEKKEQLRLLCTEESIDAEISSYIKEALEFTYPYQSEVKLHAKVTVSELKKLSQKEESEESEILIDLDLIKEEDSVEDESTEELLPAFMKKEIAYKGARRGTVYHKIMENIDKIEKPTLLGVKDYINELVCTDILTEKEAEVVNPYDIFDFLKSKIAKRMLLAKKSGKVYREQPFVFSVKANEIRTDLLSEEPVLVQGVIDCFFEEDGEYVIVDYKTDRVNEYTGEELLRERYQTQLDYYQRAIMQITGKHVKEKVVYSFYLKKEIYV